MAPLFFAKIEKLIRRDKMFKKTSAAVTASAIALALTMGTAQAQDKTKLRIQTHFATETLSGELLSLIHI